MKLDELHENLTEDTDTFLKKLRAEEAERAERFPGYPAYLSDAALQRIEDDVEKHAEILIDILSNRFGYLAVETLHPKKVQYWLRGLAHSVAHEAAGHMASEGARQADQASRTLLNGVFAGMELVKDES